MKTYTRKPIHSIQSVTTATIPPEPTAPHPDTPTRFIPVTEWDKHHTWPPVGGLRHLIFHEHSNGFHKVVRRAGRRVLIDEAAFFAWVAAQGGAK